MIKVTQNFLRCTGHAGVSFKVETHITGFSDMCFYLEAYTCMTYIVKCFGLL